MVILGDACRFRTIACARTLQGMRNELRSNVHPQMGRCWIELEQLFDHIDHVNSFAPAAKLKSQADLAEFIDHVQELGGAAIHCLVQLEADRPDVVRILRAQQLPDPPVAYPRFSFRGRGRWSPYSRQTAAPARD
jgi:hypothetical protein